MKSSFQWKHLHSLSHMFRRTNKFITRYPVNTCTHPTRAMKINSISSKWNTEWLTALRYKQTVSIFTCEVFLHGNKNLLTEAKHPFCKCMVVTRARTVARMGGIRSHFVQWIKCSESMGLGITRTWHFAYTAKKSIQFPSKHIVFLPYNSQHASCLFRERWWIFLRL